MPTRRCSADPIALTSRIVYARGMLLALETSDRNCAVAIADPATGAIAASITEDIGRGHAERLMGMIETALAQAGIAYKDLIKIAVCVGPGSFTGIRVALATATGLSIALGIPVTGVTAFQALALDAAGQTVAAVIDAHRGDVFLQIFSAKSEGRDAARQVSIEQADRETGQANAVLIGNGANFLMGSPVIHTGMPAVEAIARAALDPRFTVEPKPLYLRRPDAKPQEAYTERRALRS